MPQHCQRRNSRKQKTKSIDIAWLQPFAGVGKYQTMRWSNHWQVAAAFEIEGCNVSISESGSFLKDVCALESLQTRGEHQFERFIVLYTAAHDRSSLDTIDSAREYLIREAAVASTSIAVMVCGQPHWRKRLPQK
jgi:hypothetical protein